ncbi:MAG: hypothetical protein K2Q26_01665 [Bdellovibrionales bacterium]|nr:hypothetical protein [Bdellovibrionales bacterium]
MKRFLTSGFFLFLLLSQTTFHYFYSDSNEGRHPAAAGNALLATPQAAASLDEIDTIYQSAIQNEILLKERADVAAQALTTQNNEFHARLAGLRVSERNQLADLMRARRSGDHTNSIDTIRIRSARSFNLSMAQMEIMMTMNNNRTSITPEQQKRYLAMLSHLRLLSAHSSMDNSLFAYPYSPDRMLRALPTRMAPPSVGEIPVTAPAAEAPVLASTDPQAIVPAPADAVRTAVGPSPAPVAPEAAPAAVDPTSNAEALDELETEESAPGADTTTQNGEQAPGDEDEDDAA